MGKIEKKKYWKLEKIEIGKNEKKLKIGIGEKKINWKLGKKKWKLEKLGKKKEKGSLKK